MPLRTLTLATLAAVFALGAAAPAFADWDGWRRHEWREHDWRERAWRRHEWREHEWRRHHLYEGYRYVPPGYGYYAPPGYSYYR
jgi:hypothetical protein